MELGKIIHVKSDKPYVERLLLKGASHVANPESAGPSSKSIATVKRAGWGFCVPPFRALWAMMGTAHNSEPIENYVVDDLPSVPRIPCLQMFVLARTTGYRWTYPNEHTTH